MEHKKLYIETYGCQMNVADSEVVAAISAFYRGGNPGSNQVLKAVEYCQLLFREWPQYQKKCFQETVPALEQAGKKTNL